MKEALQKKPVRIAVSRVRKKKKPAEVNVIKRIREIAIAVGGFGELELPERFKHRTRD